jgi:hypothetical protein
LLKWGGGSSTLWWFWFGGSIFASSLLFRWGGGLPCPCSPLRFSQGFFLALSWHGARLMTVMKITTIVVFVRNRQCVFHGGQRPQYIVHVHGKICREPPNY